MTKPLDPELMAILVCPLSHAPLVQEGQTLVSTDSDTRRRYTIMDGIPNMLIDESEELRREEWEAIMKRHGRL